MQAVFITGANRGLGRALVESFLARGCWVFALTRSTAHVDELCRAGRNCVPIVGDVTDRNVGGSIAGVLRKHAVELSLLINNAGSGGVINSMRDGVEDEVMEQLNVHCVGALRVTRASLPFLRRASGALIVNVCSRFGLISNAAAGLFGRHGPSYAYPVAKAAQAMLTVRMAEELRGTSVKVCAIHPGRLQTTSGAADAIETAAQGAERLANWVEAPPPSVHGGFFELDSGREGW